MLTPAELKAMTPEDRTQLFDTLATTYYGTDRYAAQLAEDMEISRPTVFRWKRTNEAPAPVIWTLYFWVNSDLRAGKVMQDWHAIAPAMDEAVKALSRVAATLASVSRRMPAAPDDAPASEPAVSEDGECPQ